MLNPGDRHIPALLRWNLLRGKPFELNKRGVGDWIVVLFEERKKGNSKYKLERISGGNVTGPGNNQYPGQWVNICVASTRILIIYHQHRSIYSI